MRTAFAESVVEDAYRKLTCMDAPSLVERNRALHRMLLDRVTIEHLLDQEKPLSLPDALSHHFISGELHFGLTPEALFREHESRPWNPMIARAFYRRGIIETWGRGTLKIARLMREAGQELPTVSLRPGAVVMTFGLAEANAPGTPEMLPGDAGKTTGKTTGKTPAAVLQLLAEDPNLSVPQVAARLKKSELTIHRAIRTLRESGRLTRVGPDKGGYWKVLE